MRDELNEYLVILLIYSAIMFSTTGKSQSKQHLLQIIKSEWKDKTYILLTV